MTSTALRIDTLLEARWIIPVDPPHTTLTDHAIAIQDGKIIAILPTVEALSQFSPEQHFVLNHHLIIPGLINTHTHAAMTLMRGMADDLPLMDWLKNCIWPVEKQWVDTDFVLAGTTLACAEMLKGGITCFNDMYFFPEKAVEAAAQTGMRATIGLISIEFPTAYATDANDYLAKGLMLREQYLEHPTLSFCLAPHAPYTVSDSTLSNIFTFANQLDLPIHMHLHETSEEIASSLHDFGIRPIERLQKLNLLGPNLIGVHMVHLTNEEINLLKLHNCNVVHCPSSNMKLASGIAPIVDLVNASINVAIGTDGAASNNRLDMFEEMRLTSLLGKVTHGAQALPAHQVLRMATLNGAITLGIEALTGSLSVGKAADITAIDFSGLELSPCFNPLSHLIYVAGREHVSHVWVNGQLLLNEGELVTLNEAEIIERTQYWQNRITSKQ
mgnify:FL=1